MEPRPGDLHLYPAPPSKSPPRAPPSQPGHTGPRGSAINPSTPFLPSCSPVTSPSSSVGQTSLQGWGKCKCPLVLVLFVLLYLYRCCRAARLLHCIVILFPPLHTQLVVWPFPTQSLIRRLSLSFSLFLYPRLLSLRGINQWLCLLSAPGIKSDALVD